MAVLGPIFAYVIFYAFLNFLHILVLCWLLGFILSIHNQFSIVYMISKELRGKIMVCSRPPEVP